MRSSILTQRGGFSSVFNHKFRMMAVGLSLIFVLGGVLHPSAATAIPIGDFSLSFPEAQCAFCSSGTLYLTSSDGINSSFDASRVGLDMITTSAGTFHLFGGPTFGVVGDFTSLSFGKSFTMTIIAGTQLFLAETFPSLFVPLRTADVHLDLVGSGHITPVAGAGVPEPAALILLSIGMLGLAGARWWQHRQAR